MSVRKGLVDKLEDLKDLVRDNVSPPIVNEKLLEEVESLIQLAGKLTAELVHLRLAQQKNLEAELLEKEKELAEKERQARVVGVDLVKMLKLPDPEGLAKDPEHVEWLNEVAKLSTEKQSEVVNRFFLGLHENRTKEKLTELRKKSLESTLNRYTVKETPSGGINSITLKTNPGGNGQLNELRRERGEYIPPPLSKEEMKSIEKIIFPVTSLG